MPQMSFVPLQTPSISHPTILFTDGSLKYTDRIMPSSSKGHENESPEMLHFF